jgi:hypothetical protein
MSVQSEWRPPRPRQRTHYTQRTCHGLFMCAHGRVQHERVNVVRTQVAQGAGKRLPHLQQGTIGSSSNRPTC